MSFTAKLIVIFLLISLLPVLGASFFTFRQGAAMVQDQTVADLTLTAELAQGYVLTFFDKIRARAADWAADGYVRAEAEAIIASSSPARSQQLGLYLKDKIQPIDPTIVITDLLDLSGNILASTDQTRIGGKLIWRDTSRDQSDQDKQKWHSISNFPSLGSAKVGQAFVSEMSIASDAPDTPMLRIMAPLISLKTNQMIGILVNNISADELNKILSGQQQTDLGSRSGWLGGRKTLELYLVNKDGYMITPSRFVSRVVLTKKINAPAFAACQNGQLEYSGNYINYRGADVLGASVCPQNQWWALLAEVEKGEALSSISRLRLLIIIITIPLILAALLVGLIFGRRLVGRIGKNLKTLKEIEKGNFAARAEVKGNDAIAQVGTGINSAAVKIEEFIDQLKHVDEMKNKFIQIVSHQLRTPLNAIRWNLESLLAGEMGRVVKAQEGIMKISYQANKEVISRIDDLLIALDIEQGTVQLAKEKGQLSELLLSVLQEYKHGADLKKLKITSEIASDLRPLEADLAKIRVVFAKLVDNAITYNKEEGNINISLAKQGKGVRFQVEDTGMGIANSEKPHIFGRFYRASNAFLAKPDASGLGLYIAKHFIEAHGGKIGFESTEGKSSAFWFEI